jgi:predicted HicB family RNase H-like nuclease
MKFHPLMVKVAFYMKKSGHSVKEISKALRCSRSTLYRWCKEHPRFSQAVEKPKSQKVNLRYGKKLLHQNLKKGKLIVLK